MWNGGGVAAADKTTTSAHFAASRMEDAQRSRATPIDNRVFRQLVEHIREVFWVTDVPKTKTIYISPGYEAIWGRTCASLYASPHNWLEAIHPEDRERVREASVSKQASNEYDEIYRIIRPDGSIRWIHDRAFLVKDEAGEGDRIVGVADDITPAKLAEEAVRKAEADYNNLFENAMEGVFHTTPEGRFLNANPAFAKMLGYADAEELMTAITDIGRELYVHPERRVEFKRRIESEGMVLGWETEVYRKDRSKIWIRTNARIVRDACGKMLYYQGTNLDVTKRKAAEAQLAMLGHAVESTTEPMSITDLQDRFTFVNQAFLKIYGYTEAEVLGRTPEMLCSPKNPGQLIAEILRETRTGGWRGELLDLRKDGTEFPIWLSTSQIKDESGQVIGLMGVARDITQLRQAQAARRELAAIVENAGDAIFSVTLDGTLVTWNRAAERIYGYTAAEAIGQPVTMLLTSGCAANVPAILEDVVQGNSLENHEAVHVRKNSSPVTVSLTVSPIRDDNGRIICASVITRDITQRIQLEKEILESSAGERRRIGHDLHDGLCQYLAGIAFRAKALEQTLAAEGLPSMREARELTALVSNAIAQTRSLARGLDPIEVENRGLIVALQDLAIETEKLFEIRCLFASRVSEIKVDGQTGLALYRITQEAIHNAIKHGTARRIQTELKSSGDHLCLEIQDDGSGFDMQARGSNCGMGLRIMNYRARSIGAVLLVKSHPNQARGWNAASLLVRFTCTKANP
jgi:PAS domain S-box-containing protein